MRDTNAAVLAALAQTLGNTTGAARSAIEGLAGARPLTDIMRTQSPVPAMSASGGAFASAVGLPGGIRSGDLSPAERWLVGKESSGRTWADNPTSTAFGLGQLLIANRRKYAAQLGVSPDTQDYGAQLEMMRRYIRDRYGTAERAAQFHQARGYY